MTVRSPEELLPRRAKQVLAVTMALLIFILLLSTEESITTPFMYVGF